MELTQLLTIIRPFLGMARLLQIGRPSLKKVTQSLGLTVAAFEMPLDLSILKLIRFS